MARVGITLENVKQAKETILARSESISIDAVRAELGHTGSKSTIHRHLKLLSAGEEKLPTEMHLSEELQQLLNHVAARLKKEAYATLEEKTEAFEQNVRDKDDRVAALSEQNSELIAYREKLHDELEAAVDENALLKARMEKADQDIALKSQQIKALEQQVTIADRHNASLEAKHQDARQALTHYRGTMAQQREQESAKHEQECAQLQQACHATSQALTGKQTALGEAQRRIEALDKQIAVVTSERDTSYGTENELKNKIRLYRDKIDELTTKYIAMQAEYEHVQGRNIKLDSVNGELELANKTLRDEKGRLEGQCQTQKELLDMFKHGNLNIQN
ncbi:DNA-binding protein [Alteromonas macleodii]|uniref:DNA-binding protein n=1 Tax=Alteromonas macleodii TaxID=28108 RepID=UPI00066E98CE|nr:DNA-binding protein [Alteromonas macleodii]CAI3957833.1 replication region DNA-binding N-term [Alteromonas macleodii]VTP52828.1 replication region DNA-binding N-term [Alteromonas macleodii]|tara:strand:- start:333 stop:1337 length:1005 start_codon:yes stop_codon:yes gene_type:complete